MSPFVLVLMMISVQGGASLVQIDMPSRDVCLREAAKVSAPGFHFVRATCLNRMGD